MSLSHSPQIVTNGLVFYYDMGNPQKSWKGKPTTNLANVGLIGMSGISLTFLGLENGWKKYSMSGTFTGGTYPYIMHITNVAFTGGVTYSSSCYVKTNVTIKFNYFGTGMNYVNVPMNKSGTSVGVLQSNGSYFCGRNNFEYTNDTTQPGYILSNPINNTTFNASTDFVWIKEGQVELGEFASPFAGDAATRSNTQAIIDLTGNNTITTNSLTYNADGTFEFQPGNQTSTITLPLSSFNKSTGTISMWVYPRAYLSSNGLFVNRDNATANALDWFWIGSWNSGSLFYFRLGNGSDCCSQDLTVSNWSSVCPVNQWTNVCVTWQSGSFSRIYVNGNQIASRSITTIPSTNPSTTGRIGLGHDSGGTGSWNGLISNTKIYNRALTASEVAQNFASLRGRYGI